MQFKIAIKKYYYEETLDHYNYISYYKNTKYKYITITNSNDITNILNKIINNNDYNYSDDDGSYIVKEKYSYKINNKKIEKKDLINKLISIKCLLNTINAKNKDINKHASNTIYYSITIKEIEEIYKKINELIEKI